MIHLGIMSVWLERFVLTLLAGVCAATILTNPLHLDRFQQVTLIVAVVALSLLTARTIERSRVSSNVENGVQNDRGPDPRSTASNPTSVSKTDPPDERASPANEEVPPAPDTEAAADHYRRTSPLLKIEEIRAAYKEFCDRIAERFGLGGWAPVNQLTRMVTTNVGDVEPFARAEAEVPNAPWMAIRVLVAFETPKERPIYMSYVFIGRAPNGDEIVALFDASKRWSVLHSSRSAGVDHTQLIIDTIKSQLQSLSERIAPDIRRLR